MVMDMCRQSESLQQKITPLHCVLTDDATDTIMKTATEGKSHLWWGRLTCSNKCRSEQAVGCELTAQQPMQPASKAS